MSEHHPFRFADLFAGIGGLRRVFENIGGRCVFTSEWDKFSRLTYEANFHSEADHRFAGDITEVAEEDVPSHDVLLGGFPCQPFSIAGVSKKNSLGKQHGFRCESQGTLFFDVARLIAYHRPKAFLLENVKNLIGHDGGNTFRVIRDTLQLDLGYHLSWRVIDARVFVPQHRERIFIVGFRDHDDFSLTRIELPAHADGPVLSSILHPEDGSELEDRFLDGQGKVLPKYTLSNKLWSYLKAYAAKHRAKGNGFGYGLCGPEDVARTLSARYYKDGSEILIRRGTRKNPRRLTPRECARLMGFDSLDGKSKFELPVSDTQAYRQFGNSVVVPVVQAIANAMLPYLVNGFDANSGRSASSERPGKTGAGPSKRKNRRQSTQVGVS